MISADTNILVYAHDSLCPEHERAYEFVARQAESADFVICELVLMELYSLVRNEVVVRNPLGPREAADLCQSYRRNRRWRVVDYPGGLMDPLWKLAGTPGFACRAIFDARLALTLRHHGVTEFATRNTRHFRRFGFERVWDPLA